MRLAPFKPYADVHRRAKRLAMAENDALRALDHAACLLRHGAPQHIERFETPAYAGATPEVTVAVSVYNYADVVTETLASIVASEDVDFEVVVVEDHATDDSRAVVRRFLDEHPTCRWCCSPRTPTRAWPRRATPRSPRPGRRKVMVVDADNHLYPTCLRRLADALDDDPGADAAYAILEDFGAERNLRSALAWDVERLCRANYIDAQAMLRRERLGAPRRLPPRRGRRPRLGGLGPVAAPRRRRRPRRRSSPQILGRYRVQHGSMVGLTNLAADDAIAVMRDRYPTLPWPAPHGMPGAADARR